MPDDSAAHLLVVDDEEELLKTMTIIFEMRGYRVSTAYNGIEALEILHLPQAEDEAISMVITDLQMPGMTGLMLVKEMRREEINLPVLALTGYGTKDVVVELMREGVNDYIEKPLNMKMLVSHVERLLQDQNTNKQRQHDLVSERIAALKTEYEARLLNSQEFEILGKLAVGVAHDFNNIITGISGYAEMLLDDLKGRSEETLEHYVTGILKATHTAQGVINQLRGFRRGGTEEFTSIDMQEVVGEALKLVMVPLSQRATVKTVFAGESQIVSGDRALLQNALVNLLLNAGDAMATRGVITVRTSCETIGGKSGTVSVTVSDTGCGMSEEIQEKIFEPFYTTKGSKGNGIGLSSVLNIVEKHGGALTVQSEPGKGSAFTMVFPRIVSDE